MATANVQTVWNCRWSRAGHQITGLSDALQPEPIWVCVRDGDRRAVCDDECARCSRWEPLAAAAAIPMRGAQGAILADRIVETLPMPTPAELAQAMLRVVLVLAVSEALPVVLAPPVPLAALVPPVSLAPPVSVLVLAALVPSSPAVPES